MPRPKEYMNQAQRQAAYRARHKGKQPPREDVLALLARSLQAVFALSIAQDGSKLPAHLLGGRADDTLRNLIRYIDPSPDPIRYRETI